ncbi:hypothetical protein BJ742DRAFT_826538 [Cladochytrium replicatum]|nr:hypothetical protein BJ742DRAFT_826538 [Cladochytrium replicatum]
MASLQKTVLHDDALSGLETADGFVLVDAFNGNAHQQGPLLDPGQSNAISTGQKTTEKALNPTFFWTTPHVLSTNTLIDDDDDAFTTATDMSSSWLGSIHSADQSPNCNPEIVADDVMPMDLSDGEISEEEEDSGRVSATCSDGSATTLVLAENSDATGINAGDSLMPPPPPPPSLLLHQRRSMKLKRTREPSASSISFPDVGSPSSSASGASTANSSPGTAISASLMSSGDSPPMPGLQTNPDLTAALSGLTVADSPMVLQLPPRPEVSQGKEKKQQHPPKRRASSTALQALSVPHAAPSTRRASTSIPSQGTPSRVIFTHHQRQSTSSTSSSSSDVAISNYNTLKRSEPLTTAAKKCDFCGATSTPMWRHGPIPFFVLCNSCGVKWKRGKILQDMPPASLAGSQTDDELHGGRGRSVSRRRSRVTAPASKDGGATNPTVGRRRSSVSTPSKMSSHHMARRNSVPTTPTSAKKDLLTSHLRDANDAQLATFIDAICGGVPGLDTELAVAGEVEVDIGRLDEDVWRKVCEVLCKREGEESVITYD